MNTFNRRAAMAALLAGGANAALAASAAPGSAARSVNPRGSLQSADRWTSTFLALDPVERFRQAMRIQRSRLGCDGSRARIVVAPSRRMTQVRGYRPYLTSLYRTKNNGVNSIGRP